MDDIISRQEAIDALEKMSANYGKIGRREWHPHIEECKSELRMLPSAQPEPCGDVVSRNSIVQKLNKMDRYVSTELRLCDTDKIFPRNEVFIVDDVYEEIVEQLPSVQPEPMSDAYAKAVWTWLLDYQIKAAELKGRYTPYEVLSWVANDWRKEYG